MAGLMENLKNFMRGGAADSEAADGPDNIPQSEPVCEGQVPNSAGGHSFVVDDLMQVRRFLCLGCETGTYYTSEAKLALDNAQTISKLINNGRGQEVLDLIIDFSVQGRTAKQNPIIFTLAMLARQDKDKILKIKTYENLSVVCRIPTHLFMFIGYCESLSKAGVRGGTGWGRAHRKAVSNWYTNYHTNPQKLAMHVTKYQNREGWTHKDVLRLAHPKTDNVAIEAIFKYITKGLEVATTNCLKEDSPEEVTKLFTFLNAVEAVKKMGSAEVEIIVDHIRANNLVREHIPNCVLSERSIWMALLEDMPMTAMIRNLGKMSSIGLLSTGRTGDADALRKVIQKLGDEAVLKKARIHPFAVLQALRVYSNGAGDKGKLKWQSVPQICTALDGAFYKSFKFVESTNKRYCLAIDVSGSMGCPIQGSSSLSCRDGAAAMAMVTARTEKNHTFLGFSHKISPIGIKADMSLEKVCDVIDRMPMGGTDCALPMIFAKTNHLKFDVFVVYTDSETWFGGVHPHEALVQYRKDTKIWDARLIVCGMAANKFTIADPSDPGMFDMVGFDSGAPEVMRNFINGKI